MLVSDTWGPGDTLPTRLKVIRTRYNQRQMKEFKQSDSIEPRISYVGVDISGVTYISVSAANVPEGAVRVVLQRRCLTRVYRHVSLTR